jgi:hypothetical protein
MNLIGNPAWHKALTKELIRHYEEVLREMPQGQAITDGQRFVDETKEVLIRVFGGNARLFWKKYPAVAGSIEALVLSTFRGRYPYSDSASEAASGIFRILRKNPNPELGTADATTEPQSD